MALKLRPTTDLIQIQQLKITRLKKLQSFWMKLLLRLMQLEGLIAHVKESMRDSLIRLKLYKDDVSVPPTVFPNDGAGGLLDVVTIFTDSVVQLQPDPEKYQSLLGTVRELPGYVSPPPERATSPVSPKGKSQTDELVATMPKALKQAISRAADDKEHSVPQDPQEFFSDEYLNRRIPFPKSREEQKQAAHVDQEQDERDALAEESLAEARIDQALGLFSVLSTDADNLFVVLSTRRLNAETRIETRIATERTRPKSEQLLQLVPGGKKTRGLLPARLSHTGHRMASAARKQAHGREQPEGGQHLEQREARPPTAPKTHTLRAPDLPTRASGHDVASLRTDTRPRWLITTDCRRSPAARIHVALPARPAEEKRTTPPAVQ